MSDRLAVSGLELFRGERCLIRDLSFAIESGEGVLLEGANGSGKTSLLRAMAGLVPVDGGEILWNDVAVREAGQGYRASLAWLGHRAGLKGDLTLAENLALEAALGPQREQDFDQALQRVGLQAARKLPVRALSAGQQRRVALLRLLLADVSLWLLDEPFTNLDRDGRALVLDLVDEHLERGGLCAMSAHDGVAADSPLTRVQLT